MRTIYILAPSLEEINSDSMPDPTYDTLEEAKDDLVNLYEGCSLKIFKATLEVV